jgi:hypothetical protein
MSKRAVSDAFDGLDAIEKAAVEAALNRCRVLAGQIESKLRHKRPEHFFDELSPLDLAPGQNGGCVLSRSSTARMRSPKNDGVLKEQFVMAVTSFESRQVHRRSQSAPGAPRRSPTSVQIGAAPTGRGPNAQQHTHAVRQHTAQRQHSSDGSI